MSKIIQVINTMITNKDKIKNVIQGGNEYFFKFNDKYKWSVSFNQEQNKSYLHLYPDSDIALSDLASIENWDAYSNFITYRSDDFKSLEALESFKELYDVVKTKLLGAEEILDDILKLE